MKLKKTECFNKWYNSVVVVSSVVSYVKVCAFILKADLHSFRYRTSFSWLA